MKFTRHSILLILCALQAVLSYGQKEDVSAKDIRATRSFVFPIYSDTTTANTGGARKPGSYISTYTGGAKTWFRNATGTQWLELGAGGGTSYTNGNMLGLSGTTFSVGGTMSVNTTVTGDYTKDYTHNGIRDYLVQARSSANIRATNNTGTKTGYLSASTGAASFGAYDNTGHSFRLVLDTGYTATLIHDDGDDVVHPFSLYLKEISTAESAQPYLLAIGENGLVQKVENASTNLLVEAPLYVEDDVLKYQKPCKVYKALVRWRSGTGFDVIVLENTLGGAPTFAKQSTGDISLNSSGLFTSGKTLITMTPHRNAGAYSILSAQVGDNVSTEISLVSTTEGAFNDDGFYNYFSLIVEVYP